MGTLGGLVLDPSALNNKSQVVGTAFDPIGTTNLAFLWQNGMASSPGALPGDVESHSNSINDKSQVVGQSCDKSGFPKCSVFLWQNGVMYDFNTLVPKHAKFYVIETLGINDRGQIVGYGIPGSSSQVHGFLATPCDAQNPDHKGCQDERGASTSVALPENVQRTLRRLNALHHIYWPSKTEL